MVIVTYLRIKKKNQKKEKNKKKDHEKFSSFCALIEYIIIRLILLHLHWNFFNSVSSLIHEHDREVDFTIFT